MHSYNLAAISEFYKTENQSLSTQLLLRPHQVEQATSFDLPIFGSNVSQILAADKTDSYLLTKVAESLKTNSIIYHNPTQAVLDDVLRTVKSRSFFSLDLNFALIVLAYVALGFMAKKGYQMYQQMTILKLTAPAAMIAATHAFELKPEFVVTTLQPTGMKDIAKTIESMIADVRHLDTAHFTLMTCILLCVVIGTTLGIKRALGRYSFLYIEILSRSTFHQLRFATLPDASRNNVVRVSKNKMKIQMANYGIFGVLALTPRAPKLLNVLTGTSTRLRNFTLVAPWTMWKIQRMITTDEYDITPIIVNTHEYSFLETQQKSPTAPDFV
ncbi:MAG TPA: hypothetical protein VLS45_04600 [Methylomicrobium sp.]|nr:hypothetical protein [Methylomicrobium sp.]